MLYKYFMCAIFCLAIKVVVAQDKIEFHMFKSGDSIRVAMNNSTVLYAVFIDHDSDQIHLFDSYSADTFSIYKDRIYQINLLKAVDNIPVKLPVKNTKTETHSAQVEVLLIDGTVLKGKMVKSLKEYVVITSPLIGEANINRKQIVSIKYLNPNKTTNKPIYQNLANRYILSPSAIGLKKGEGYYQNSYFYIQTFNVGITNHLSVSASTEISSLLASYPIFVITPKYSYEVAEDIHLGCGVMMIFVPFNKEVNERIIFGTYTYGNKNINFSFNVGYSAKYTDIVLFSFSGFMRVSNKFGWVTDNFIFPVQNYLSTNLQMLSIGGRFIGKKSNLDLSISIVSNSRNQVLPLPFASYAYRF